MHKFIVFCFSFILQCAFGNAVPRFDGMEKASSLFHSTDNHQWHFGSLSENIEKYDSSNLAINPRSIENLNNKEDNIILEVRQGGESQQSMTMQQPQPMQMQQPQPMQMQQPQPMQMQQPQPMQMQQPQPMQMQQPQPMQLQQPQPIQLQQPQPMQMQQPQPMPMQQPQSMPMQQPHNMSMQQQPPMPMQQSPPRPMPQQQPTTMQMPPQSYQMQQPTQPMVGGSMQMHPPDVQFPSQFPPQPIANTGIFGQPGYPMQSFPFNPQMNFPTSPTGGWPANTANNGFPYNMYPPTGQMQLPIPPNQFNTYGPSTGYTNPVYGTPLSPSQNDLEAQIASAFLSNQMMNMLRDPHSRESLLYFVSELRGFLSNPNSIPFMKAINNHAQDLNTPALFNQNVPQTMPHSTSTIVQVEEGANHLLDKLKAKGGKIMSFVKDIADANNKMLEGTASGIPVFDSFAKIGTGLTKAGVGMIDSIVSPLLHPSGSGGTTTVTTVSSPQPMASFPATQYQTSAVMGK